MATQTITAPTPFPKRSELSKDLLVGLEIYGRELNGERVGFSELAADLVKRGFVSDRHIVSMAEDALMDQGLLSVEYVKMNGVNTPVYKLCKHGLRFWVVIRTSTTD